MRGGSGRFRRRASWICVTAFVLGACSGTLRAYGARVVPSRGHERPLVAARRCLEELGYDLRFMELEAGVLWGEKIEVLGDGAPTVVVSEVAVMRGDDGVRITGRSRRGSSVSGGWEPVGVSEGVRGDVDLLADRLGEDRGVRRARCAPYLSRGGGRGPATASGEATHPRSRGPDSREGRTR